MAPPMPKPGRTVKDCINMLYDTDQANRPTHRRRPPTAFVNPASIESHSQVGNRSSFPALQANPPTTLGQALPLSNQGRSVRTPSTGTARDPHECVNEVPTLQTDRTEVRTDIISSASDDGQCEFSDSDRTIGPDIDSDLELAHRTNAILQSQAMAPIDSYDQARKATHEPVYVKARHDRDTYYLLRTRADGSQSLIKSVFRLDVQPESNGPRNLRTTAADASLILEEEEEIQQDSGNIETRSGAEDNETSDEFKTRLIHVLEQMMFVSGEQAEPSAETTWMIEEIVREQVVEMLKEATVLANRRGSKSISIVDLIFQIRHNPAKVSRLKTFLSWKDVRKNVKDSDDKAGGADADALDLEDGALPGANPAAPQKSSTTRKAKLVLPWEVQSFYNETVPEREDEEDEEEEEQNEATLARLASADERTKNMTREEYVYWSDCRQASFTFRKGKRFREWAGFGTIIDSKPNDDVVDILGFLTFEIVQTLTEEALRVKNAEDLANKKASGSRGDSENSKKRKREGCTLFEMVEEDKTPVEPKHVREAFRRLQLVPKRYTFMRQGYAGVRTPLRMI